MCTHNPKQPIFCWIRPSHETWWGWPGLCGPRLCPWLAERREVPGLWDTFLAPTSRLWRAQLRLQSPVEGRAPEDEHEDRRHTRTHGALSRTSPGNSNPETQPWWVIRYNNQLQRSNKANDRDTGTFDNVLGASQGSTKELSRSLNSFK